MANDIQNEAIAWLARLNSEALTTDEEAAFFAWLQQSEAHQAAYIKAEQLWLRGDVLTHAVKAAKPKPAVSLWWGGLAMACLFAIALVVLWPQAPTYTQLRAEAVLAEFGLPDGSHVTLKPDASVAYLFAKGERRIRLIQGEAFFDVAHNRAKPFVVQTDYGQVRVVGTQFSVGLSAQGVDVLVLSGSVEVAPSDNSQKAVLTKNQAVSFKQVANGEAPTAIKAAQLLSWRYGQWLFENTPLSEAVAAIAEELKQRVAVPTAHAGLPVTGVLPMAEPLQALKTIAASHGLVVQETSAGLQLLSSGEE